MIYINHIFDLYFPVKFSQLSCVDVWTFVCGRVDFRVCGACMGRGRDACGMNMCKVAVHWRDVCSFGPLSFELEWCVP